MVSKPQESIIAVMGSTGAGKSTFVNTLLGPLNPIKMEVGHDLISCTKEVSSAVIEYRGRRVVLVDTPGFDDTHLSDYEILQRIAKWLKTAYKDKIALGGVIYLHNISNNRLSGAAAQNLKVFKDMCGHEAFKKVALGITHWDDGKREACDARLKSLQEVFWKDMLDHGAFVHKMALDQASAFQVIDILLENDERAPLMHEANRTHPNHQNSLQIQTEMVVEKKRVPETAAGLQLRCSLQELLDQQKRTAGTKARIRKGEVGPEIRADYERSKQQMESLGGQIRSLTKVPLPTRIRRFLKI